MADDDREGGGEPDYKVYKGGLNPFRRGSRKSSGEKSSGASSAGGSGKGSSGGDGGPDYNVYRGSSGPLSKLKGLSLGSLGDRFRRGDGDRGGRSRFGGGRRPWRRALRWALIGVGLWLLASVVLFAASAQIQKGKLDDAAAEELGAFPLLAASGQTILVVGTDARPEATGAEEAETREKCIDQGARGSAPSADCSGFRADTLMLVRAGGGAFEKLSIPRDTLAEIPGSGAGKINSAYSTGGAALQVRTVENFLGIDIDHVVLLDFQGFSEFIDAIGGVEVNNATPLKSKIDGGSGQGGITLKLGVGEQDLDGARALAYARTRNNEYCDGGPNDRKLCNGPETDLDRARRQQEVLSSIKDRLTNPLRIPVNFLRGPLIAWNAPKAMITDMGAATLPQLAIALAIGGDSGTKILGRKNSTGTSAGNISIPVSECEKAVRQLTGENGPRTPECSPAI